MTFRHFSQARRYNSRIMKPVSFTLTKFADKVKNFQTPARLKGTILERWGKYWKNLYIDYKDVAVDVAKDCKERPIRASVYLTLLFCGFYTSKHNPDECSFREQLLRDAIKIMGVGEAIRNPISEHHIKWMEKCYNQGIVRRLDLGIISLIWLDNYDKGCSLYKATCPYLKPRYISFYQRVVDVGFLDNWWLLDSKMKDYDVNEAEYSNVQV